MATKAQDLALAASNVDSTGAVNATTVDSLDSSQFVRNDAVGAEAANGFTVNNQIATGHIQFQTALNTSANDYVRANIVMSRNKDQIYWDSDTGEWVHAGGNSTDWSMMTHTSGEFRLYSGPSYAEETRFTNSGLRSSFEAVQYSNSAGWKFNSPNGGEFVFNESGLDRNFRVESATDTHALFVDAGLNRVGIKRETPAAALHIQDSSATLRLNSSATDSDGIITMGFWDTLTNRIEGAHKPLYIVNYYQPLQLGYNNVRMLEINATEVVVNNDSGNYDFRVETSANTHALFVDGASAGVTINNNSVNHAFNVYGAASTDDAVKGSDAIVAGFYQNNHNHAAIRVQASGDATDGSEDKFGAIEIIGSGFGSSHGRHAWIGAEAVSGNSFRTRLHFKLRGASNTGYQFRGTEEAPTVMTLDGERFVGIRNPTPTVPLEVNGEIATTEGYNHFYERVKTWTRVGGGASSYSSTENQPMENIGTTRVPPGNSGMIPIAAINTRAFQNYVCIKTNYTGNNLMFQLRFQGYMYGMGICDAHAGGYTYGTPANSVISKNFYRDSNAGVQYIADLYRLSTGHLCIKIYLGHTGYTEGWGNLWFGGHGDGWRNIQVEAVQIRNDGANHQF